MTNDTRERHTKLFKSLQYLRLKHALQLVECDLEKNKSVPASINDGFFKRVIKKGDNLLKDHNYGNYSRKKEEILAEYNSFLSNNANATSLFDERNIRRIISETFSQDEYALEKTMFSISVIFDSEYKYAYEKETLAYLSGLLWGREERLSNFKNEIEKNYRELAKQPWSTEQKFVLAGTAALMLFTATVPALAIGGLSASGITGGLAGFGAALGLGGTMVEGVGLMVLAEVLLDGAVIGFTYALLNAHNKNKVRESFRDMNYQKAAQMLAIKCYIMHVAKQTMPPAVFKEKTSELLQMIADFKSDLDYMLLIEGENVEENKKKLNVFHNLDDKLVKMLCV